VERECERHLAVAALGLDRRIELAEEAHPSLIAEPDHVAGLKLLGRAHQRAPARSVDPLHQGRLDPRLVAATDAPAAQARGDHLRVVENQRVAWSEQIRQVAHAAIIELRSRPHDEQARRITRTDRPQRDAVRRQIEIEEVRSHACRSPRMPHIAGFAAPAPRPKWPASRPRDHCRLAIDRHHAGRGIATIAQRRPSSTVFDYNPDSLGG
jgi:hypothetical protein